MGFRSPVAYLRILCQSLCEALRELDGRVQICPAHSCENPTDQGSPARTVGRLCTTSRYSVEIGVGCGRPAVLDCFGQAEAKICKEGDVGDSCSPFCEQGYKLFLV